MTVYIAPGDGSTWTTFQEDAFKSDYHTITKRVQKTKTLGGGILVNTFGDSSTVALDREFKIVASLTAAQESSIMTIITGNETMKLMIKHTNLVTGVESTIIAQCYVVCPSCMCRWGELDATFWTTNAPA